MCYSGLGPGFERRGKPRFFVILYVMLYSRMVFKRFAIATTLVFSLSSVTLLAACGDDGSANKVDETGEVIGPDGKVIPDSILASDSLYDWYMDQQAKEKNLSSSSGKDAPKLSSSSGKSGGKDGGEEKGITGDEEEEADTKVHMLPPAGFYSELTIPVPAAVNGGKIRCTFDGSAPTESSEEFTEPYTVTGNTPVRCAEFVDGEIVRESSHTFFINENVSMPVVAISVDPKFFQSNYIYEPGCAGSDPQYCNPGLMADVEYPVHVEFFENGSSSAKKTWQIDAGISLMGGWSRTYEKKSVSIKMRKIYEDGRLKYSLFTARPDANKFKGFNLRNGGNRYVGDFHGDAALTSLAEGTSVDYQRSRMVVVFYNGRYYGIHDLRERLNEHFVETNYGIDSKLVDMVKHLSTDVVASGGTADAYTAMLALFAGNSHFKTDSSDAEESQIAKSNYARVQGMLDVGNFADYIAMEFFIHNGDWPDNNVRAWRSPDQPFKYMIFDVDHGFGWDWAVPYFEASTHNMFSWMKTGGQRHCTGDGCLAGMYLKLIQNPDFRRLFINHSAVLFTSYLTSERVNAAVARINSQIPSSEMDRDLNTFVRPGGPYMDGFDRTGSHVVSYGATRTGTIRSEYRTEFGLGEDIDVTIKAKGNGKVLVDGMQLPSTNYTGKFFAGNGMLLTAVPAAGATFTGWSDGKNTDNPRLVSPEDGDTFTANFQ